MTWIPSSIRALVLTILSFNLQAVAWHHDGIPIDSYQSEPLAIALYEAAELEEHVELIFDANETDSGSPDSEYVELFGDCKQCASQILKYIRFVACVRMIEQHELQASIKSCQDGLAPLQFKSLEPVWAWSDLNPFKSAVVYFLAYLRLHQNRLEISNLVEF